MFIFEFNQSVKSKPKTAIPEITAETCVVAAININKPPLLFGSSDRDNFTEYASGRLEEYAKSKGKPIAQFSSVYLTPSPITSRDNITPTTELVKGYYEEWKSQQDLKNLHSDEPKLVVPGEKLLSPKDALAYFNSTYSVQKLRDNYQTKEPTIHPMTEKEAERLREDILMFGLNYLIRSANTTPLAPSQIDSKVAGILEVRTVPISDEAPALVAIKRGKELVSK
ncbi:MAG: hypothetical protein Q7S22_07190 [Candidatus Micrarchaeota archaeon]|nr:hypothetical protein [Candidatus Micrarchaeota archaeon]